MTRGLVSIITPSYNSADYLGVTIESVSQQSYPHWEMLIIDDGSSDTSVDIARYYAEQDSRIRVIALKKNSGAAFSRNTGIEEARGRYIAFLDSDDLYHPAKLEKQLAFMQQHKHVLTYSYYDIITEAGEPAHRIVRPAKQLNYQQMLKSNQIGCLTAMYDSQQLGKVFMPDIRKRQDYGLWLRILKTGVIAHCLPEVLAHYRVRGNSISRNKVELLRYNWQLFRHIEGLHPLSAAYYLGWNVYRSLSRR